jgi:hypothetical protein
LAPKPKFEHDAKLDVGARARRDHPSARRGAEGVARALTRRESTPRRDVPEAALGCKFEERGRNCGVRRGGRGGL